MSRSSSRSSSRGSLAVSDRSDPRGMGGLGALESIMNYSSVVPSEEEDLESQAALDEIDAALKEVAAPPSTLVAPRLRAVDEGVPLALSAGLSQPASQGEGREPSPPIGPPPMAPRPPCPPPSEVDGLGVEAVLSLFVDTEASTAPSAPLPPYAPYERAEKERLLERVANLEKTRASLHKMAGRVVRAKDTLKEEAASEALRHRAEVDALRAEVDAARAEKNTMQARLQQLATTLTNERVAHTRTVKELRENVRAAGTENEALRLQLRGQKKAHTAAAKDAAHYRSLAFNHACVDDAALLSMPY